MTVYVLHVGEYEQRGVAGVYSSLERAQAVIGGEWRQLHDTLWKRLEPGDGWDIEAHELDE